MKTKWCLPLMIMILLQSGPGWADAATKLARGASNAGLGWFEIINEMGNESDRRGPIIGMGSGAIRGAVFGIVRMAAGAYEIVTFPFPNGKRGYAPVVQPESVFARR